MDHQLWMEILALLAQIDKRPRRWREDFSAEDIVKTWLWAVLHDRPVSWACRRRHWPLHERRWKRPSPSTMSRRLRTHEVRRRLEQIERCAAAPQGRRPLVWMIDGKPLVISGCSKDRQAGYGRAAGGKAKGYKIHAVAGWDGSVAAWRVAAMNKDERVMARRLLRDAPVHGYVLADSNDDSNALHAVCHGCRPCVLVLIRGCMGYNLPQPLRNERTVIGEDELVAIKASGGAEIRQVALELLESTHDRLGGAIRSLDFT